MSDTVERLRALCFTLPEVTEKLSHGEPTWFVRRMFVSYADRHHDERVGFWCAAASGVAQDLIRQRPELYFRPPYVGQRGWLGVWVDDRDAAVDWTDVAEIVAAAYREIAPRALVERLDAMRAAVR